MWLYNVPSPMSWDFLPAGAPGGVDGRGAVACPRGVAGGVDDWTTARAWGRRAVRRWVANSQLTQLAPDGRMQAQYVRGCTGRPLNYNQLTHELRVDHTSADLRVIATTYKVQRREPGVAMREYDNLHFREWNTTYDTFLGQEVVAWHRATNDVETLVDLWDYTNLSDATWTPLKNTFTTTPISCSGGASVSALDYHHCSSASVGPSGDLLVALRNLDVVLCFAAGGGGGLRWTLASTDAMSDFAFAHDIDKFYTPHSAVELDDGRILLMDDGKSRPGCTVAQNYAGCWSRAALYSLD